MSIVVCYEVIVIQNCTFLKVCHIWLTLNRGLSVISINS